MNRRLLSRLLSILMITALVLPAAALPMEVNAASVSSVSSRTKDKKKANYKLYFSNIDSNTVIKKGKKLKVKYYASNGKKVKVRFKSSNKKIATISSKGTIKAKKNGTVKITIYAKSNKKIKKTVKIKVGKPVTSLKIKGIVYMRPGRSSDLDTSASPSNATNKKVTWTSSNTGVATVNSNGKVSAKAAGRTTITATAKDGSGVSKSVTVIVHKFLKSDTKWVAHRGYHDSAIENSALAFMLAGQAGYWGAECDVWETGHEYVEKQTIPVKPIPEPEPDPVDPEEPAASEVASADSVIADQQSPAEPEVESESTESSDLTDQTESAGQTDLTSGDNAASEPEVIEEPVAQTSGIEAVMADGDGDAGNTGDSGSEGDDPEPEEKTQAVIDLEEAIAELPTNEIDIIESADQVNAVQAMYDALTEDETYTVDTTLLQRLFDAKYIVDDYESFDIVLNHDETFTRLFGVGTAVRSLAPSAIKGNPNLWDNEYNRVCFLDKYLEVCKQYNMVPVIELKDGYMSMKATKKMVDKVYEIIGSLDQNKVHFISFYDGQLTQVKEYCKKKYNAEPYTAYLIGAAGVGNKIELARDRGFTGIDITRTFLTTDVMNKCRSYGLKVDTWTYYNSLSDDDRLYKHFVSGQFQVESATIDTKLFS